MSSNDIEAGAIWLNELFEQLEQSTVGIICLTQTSLTKPWLNFEAGALAKKVATARVCPLLIDLKPSDVLPPLGAFQLKTTSKEDIFSLLQMVNASQGDHALSDVDLSEAFENRWQSLSKELSEILQNTTDQVSTPQARPPEQILDEILSLVRNLAANSPAPHVATIKNPHLVSIRQTDAMPIWQEICKKIRKERPLISAWVEQAQAAFVEGTRLVVLFPREAGLARESISRANNKAFLLSSAAEFGITEIHPAELADIQSS